MQAVTLKETDKTIRCDQLC